MSPMRVFVPSLVLSCLGTLVHAQAMTDPMRPPLVASQPAAAREAAPERLVQTIIIGPAQRYAVINGRTLAQGERIGDARIERITETDVTLRQADGKTVVLGLLPHVQKKPTATLPALSRGAPGTNP